VHIGNYKLGGKDMAWIEILQDRGQCWWSWTCCSSNKIYFSTIWHLYTAWVLNTEYFSVPYTLYFIIKSIYILFMLARYPKGIFV